MHKKIKIIPIFIFFLVIPSYLVAPASADFGGFTVEPVSPEIIIEPPAGTTIPVDASQVPPLVIIMVFFLSLSPAFAFPLELLLFFKVFSYLGYRKVFRGELFENPTRCHVYACIRNHPGIHFNAIVRKTGVRPGTLRYHLVVLQAMKKISVLSSEGHARYFENSGFFSESEKTVLKFIQNDKDRQILVLLMAHPDLNRKDLGEESGISGVMITWYMKRLCDAGIISQTKAGKNARYEINPEPRQYLEKYLALKNEGSFPWLSEPVSEPA
jgi:predicted transcriptional regulator